VSRAGGPGGATSVFLRGGNSSHTLVLVDGVRVNAATGAYDWADLTPDLIERIEIVRGPHSALYGSEAIGGVISILTRRGVRGDGVRASAEAGNLGTGRIAVDGAGARGPWDWSWSASRSETDGVSRASERNGNVEDDPWETTTLAGAFGRKLGERAEARVTVRRLDATTGLDAFDFALGPIDDPNFTQDREADIASLRIDAAVTERWTQTVRVGYSTDRLTTRDPDPDPAFHDARIDSETADLDLQADVDLGPDLGLTFGAGHERRRADSREAFSEEVDLTAVRAEARFRPTERFALTAGVRNDDHSEFGNETTWRAAASWTPADRGPRVHASAGTAFKAPTFVDLYFPFYGNPDLRPETSESYDLGIEQAFAGGRVLADLTAFRSDVRDLIVFDVSTFLAGNVARADLDGFEATVSWTPTERFGGRIAYTRTDATDADTGAWLARRPRHQASLNASFAPTERVRGTLTVLAVRDRVDAGDVPLDDYETVDVSLETDVARRFTAYLRIDNLLDDDHEEVAGFTSPGIRGVVGVRFRP